MCIEVHRLLCKTVLGILVRTFFFFFDLASDLPLEFEKRFSTSASCLGIPNQMLCSWYVAFSFLATGGNHLLGQVSVLGPQWLT